MTLRIAQTEQVSYQLDFYPVKSERTSYLQLFELWLGRITDFNSFSYLESILEIERIEFEIYNDVSNNFDMVNPILRLRTSNEFTLC